DMLFDIPASVAYVSKFFTLEPGDLLLTGSPAGVGVVSRTFLKAGDVVELSATGIGSMKQRVTTS
ncbi:MAG: fumarylacetoacetate hydrolase family protein, partial [Actinomycetota bacterium]